MLKVFETWTADSVKTIEDLAGETGAESMLIGASGAYSFTTVDPAELKTEWVIRAHYASSRRHRNLQGGKAWNVQTQRAISDPPRRRFLHFDHRHVCVTLPAPQRH